MLLIFNQAIHLYNPIIEFFHFINILILNI